MKDRIEQLMTDRTHFYWPVSPANDRQNYNIIEQLMTDRTHSQFLASPANDRQDRTANDRQNAFSWASVTS